MRCPKCNNKDSLEDMDDYFYCNDCGTSIPKCERCKSIEMIDEGDHWACENCGEANYKEERKWY